MTDLESALGFLRGIASTGVNGFIGPKAAKALLDAIATRSGEGRVGETDPDIIEVRAILHAHQRAMTPPDSGWGDMSYLKGSYDHLPTFKAALAAYRLLKEVRE